MPSIAQAANNLTNGRDVVEMTRILNSLLTDITAMRTRLNSQMLNLPGLAIKTGGSAIVTAAKSFAATVNGTLVAKTTATDMSAIAGTIATTKFAGWAFYMDAAGTITTSAKTADSATLVAALALIPATPDNKVMIGFIVVQNAAAGDFTAGTTALDAASTTTTYYDASGYPAVMAALGTTV